LFGASAVNKVIRNITSPKTYKCQNTGRSWNEVRGIAGVATLGISS
jgi:hypothetical protein